MTIKANHIICVAATTTASRQARKTITPKEIAVAKARIDATAHRLARMALMAKYAQTIPSSEIDNVRNLSHIQDGRLLLE